MILSKNFTQIATITLCLVVITTLLNSPSRASSIASKAKNVLVTAPKYNSSHFTVDAINKIVSARSNDEIVSIKFLISNTGSKILTLEVAGTSCGCTSAKLLSLQLKPGENEDFEVSVQTIGFADKNESVRLFTNDPENPQITLSVNVKMPKIAVPDPTNIELHAWQGQSYRQTMFLLMTKGVSIQKISLKLPFLHVKLLQSQLDSDPISQLYEISVSNDAPVGLFKDKIIFKLSSSSEQKLVVPVTGIIQSNIEITPNQLFLNEVLPGVVLNKTITARSHDKRSFQIQKVVCDNLQISTKIDSQKYASTHTIFITIHGDKIKNRFIDDTLTIVLSTGESLKLPIIGMVAN